MAKATKKELPPKAIAIPEGMTAKDLSPEKRLELFKQSFDKFKNEAADSFGMALDVEILATPRAIVPRMVVVDLLKKNEQQNPTQAPANQ